MLYQWVILRYHTVQGSLEVPLGISRNRDNGYKGVLLSQEANILADDLEGI